jgi:hypothetical protein
MGESEPRGEIEVHRGDEPAALPVLFRAADPLARIQETIEKADVAGRVIERLGLAQRYGDAERAFLTLHGWQVLGSLYGVVARVEWTRPLEGGAGWEARATCRTVDGRELGAGEGMCTRTEPNWRKSSDHSIRAMAQTRAARRALQGTLGFVPAMAGLDVADPDAPATRKQVGTLHGLAKLLEWSHADAHERAGVESFNDLTREQAAGLIDEWTGLAERAMPPASAGQVEELAPADRGVAGDPPAAPNLQELWARAVAAFGSKVAVLREWTSVFAPDGSVSAAQVTAEELAWLLDQATESDGQSPETDPGHADSSLEGGRRGS